MPPLISGLSSFTVSQTSRAFCGCVECASCGYEPAQKYALPTRNKKASTVLQAHGSSEGREKETA